MDVPNPSSEPEVLIQPSLDIVQNLFQTNPVIALDTEFVEAQMAYVQIGFLNSNTVCIFTHNKGFAGFSPGVGSTRRWTKERCGFPTKTICNPNDLNILFF